MQAKAKIIVVIYSLAFLALGAVVFAMAIGWTPAIDTLNTALSEQSGKIVVGLAGCAVILISMVLLFSGLKGKEERQENGVIQELKLGRVVTTTTAIDSVVRRAVRQVRGVREVRPLINITPNGLSLVLNIILSPDVKVPEVSPQIQENVRQQLFDIIGIDVLEIRIRVENIGYDPNSRVE
ncbi:MAG: alkaline shock response membrane anchor protein AmaP [Firmicutes bacterium]|nr:alkaline shock response membrane anchor protein AmaP [Bacillota bacterium]